ncbi:MAG: DNA-binding response regulator, partial [Rhodothermales bacterium]|nr:DNA-binding response regulator [Rhodothermales bacterium]
MARSNDSRETPLILIVDDEDDILDLVKYNIEKEGFDT